MEITFSRRNITNQPDTACQSGAINSVIKYKGVHPLTGNSIFGTRTGGRSSSFNLHIIGTSGSNTIRNTRTVDLGAGNDTLQGFGQGRYIGGSGIDTLILPKGTYQVRISGSRVTFTKDGITMTTSGFEKLRAGRTYDFAKLTNRQRIIF